MGFLIGIRSFDPADGPYSELAVRVEEPADFSFAARSVVVVENEVSCLAFPRVPGVAVVLGGGYAVSRLVALPWRTGRDVVYWGDLDTHGFRALDRLRRFPPATRSMLMDLPALLAHRAPRLTSPRPSLSTSLCSPPTSSPVTRRCSKASTVIGCAWSRSASASPRSNARVHDAFPSR